MTDVQVIPDEPVQIFDNPDQQKQCWVCFATADDDRTATWVKPCKCRGTTKWVHHNCLQRWVDEKQKGNTFAKVLCSQCGFEYMIIYPPLGLFTMTLERIDRLVGKVCPMLTGAVVLGAVYWSAVTYGAVTVFLVFGHQNGQELMEQADPMLLLVGLPIIPVGLICGQMWRWEDEILKLLARFLLSNNNNNVDVNAQQQPAALRDQTASATRILCTALALPIFAKFVGKWLFAEHVASPLNRTLLGGAVFLAAKGAANVYFRYQQIWRRKNQTILDYVEDPPPKVRCFSDSQVVLQP